MALSTKQSNGEPDWKDRYYKSLNELEQKEHQWQEDKNALLKNILKLGVSFQGSNEKVNQSLLVLKASLKHSKNAIPFKEIENTVHTILTLDTELEHNSANDEIDNFGYFIEELSKIDHFANTTGITKDKLEQLNNTSQQIQVVDECIANLINVIEDNSSTQTAKSMGFSHTLALLDWISLNDKYQKHLNKLKRQLSELEDESNTAVILKRIAMLISNAYMEVQNEVTEMEAFLKKVTHQLGTISLVIAETQSFHKNSLSNSSSHSKDVTEKLLSMQNDVEQCHSLEQVKSVISDSIDVLQDNMDTYLDSESERVKATVDKNAELKQRLEVMEKETDTLRQTLSEEKQRSSTDALTGIANRFAFDNRLKQEIERYERYRNNLTICLIDIDKFKHVNDTYGHKAGDKVLKIVAEKCNTRIRKSDFFARYGGEEFALILPETTLDNAAKIAEDLRNEIEKSRFHYQGSEVPVTISCGLATFAKNNSSDEVFERADKALYQAKDDGRNLVRFFN